ncbi:isoleucyl-tRNA synthetase, partial [Acrasis kona]
KETSTGKHYIIAEPRAKDVFKGKPFTKVDSFPGSKLKGRKYVPIFNYFADRADANDKVFTVCVDEYVTSTSGTGLVHQAPGFGEDDLRVCVAHGVAESKDLPCPIDGSGRFIAPVNDYLGRYIKDCDNDIAANIKSRDRLFNKGTLIHSYPFCWRSDTPLIYRAIPSWFVEVTKIKQDLLTNNQNTYWVPSNVRDAKFHNWLQDARDWSVSRSRYWGTPLPIWVSDDGEEIVVVGSVEELQQLTGTTDIKDIHRQHIDHLTIPSRQGKGTLRRVEEVFDCWFESGSMPYAQSHYPFENQDKFHNSFPADFIAEGIDQTRGWFYTLMVLGTALFNTAPFKNLVVNGLVLASDKKKMSKRLKNYDDPVDVVNMHGADALRLYLINSPVVRAENLCFKTEGVKDVVKDVFLQWVNAYRLFVQNAKRYKNAHQELFTSVEAAAFKPTNVMDKWVISMSQSLVAFVHQEMKAYRLYTVTPKLVDTVQQLTNWYVRMNRKRLKGVESKQEWYQSLCTLFNVLYTLIRTMSPFTPFLTEMMYQNLRNLVPSDQREDSIHYLDMPQFDPTLVDESIEKAVSDMQLVVVNGRILRDRSKLNLRQTVSEYVVVHHDEQFIQNVLSLQSYIKEELNCVELKATSQVQQFVKLQASAEKKLLGKRFGKKLAEYSGAIDKLSHDQISKFLKESTIEVNGESFDHQDIKVAANFIGDAETFMDVRCENGSLVLLNFVLTDELRQAGLVRSTCARVQQLRKKAGLVVEDVVDVYFVDQSKSGVLKSRQSEMEEYLSNMKLFYEEELKDQALIEEEEDGIKIILVKH